MVHPPWMSSTSPMTDDPPPQIEQNIPHDWWFTPLEWVVYLPGKVHHPGQFITQDWWSPYPHPCLHEPVIPPGKSNAFPRTEQWTVQHPELIIHPSEMGHSFPQEWVVHSLGLNSEQFIVQIIHPSEMSHSFPQEWVVYSLGLNSEQFITQEIIHPSEMGHSFPQERVVHSPGLNTDQFITQN